MTETKKNSAITGAIEWVDLTVDDAQSIRDFYSNVVGWDTSPVDMGGYADFNVMQPGNGEAVAGICHARGGNSNLPAQWLLYVRVKDINESMAACTGAGGKVLDGPRPLAGEQFCVIQDPAGAVLALVSS